MVLISLFTVLFPHFLDIVDSRGIATLPLAISTNQSSLAIAALTDIRESLDSSLEDDSQQIMENWGQVTLNAGVDAQPILEKVFPVEIEPMAVPQIKEESGQLTGMVISQNSLDTEIVLAQNTMAPKRTLEEIQLKNAYGEWEPMEVRKHKILAAVSTDSLKQPDFKDHANQLVEEELKKRKEDEFRRVLSSQAGGQIIVSKPQSSPRTVAALTPSPAQSHSAEAEAATTILNEKGLFPTKWEDHNERPVLISGQIQFSNGLAFTGQSQLSISRVYDGESQETAKIWIRDAKYEIPVKRAKGYLIAELHDQSGLLVAYKELDLSKLNKIPSNQYKIENINLKLEPVQQGAIVKVISGYSYKDKEINLEEATVTLQPFDSELKKDGEGQYVERSLEAGSDIVVKVEAKEHWPTLARVTSGTVATVRAFHNSMMKALIDIVSLDEMERKENQFKGIIWGIVTQGGKPVAGAKVEVRGDTGPLSYINNFYLPDVGMEKTSVNGMFAIVGAEDGLQSLRVVHNGVDYPAQVIKTVGGHVTFVEINFEKLQSVRLKVADAFIENKEVNASIRSLGSDVIIENVTSHQDIESQKFPLSFHFLEADAGLEYEMIRVEEPLSQHFLRFPLVQRQWLQGIVGKHKINRTPGSGTIIGWVAEEGFDLILDDGKDSSDIKYIYFNRSGQTVEKSENPAGFIIFNVPEGQRTLTLLPHSRKTVKTKVLTIDSDFLSIVYQ